jgi:hypothetical protein
MLRCPPVIAPEVWDSWPESLKRTIVEIPEVYTGQANNSNIDPLLLGDSNGHLAQRHIPHDASRDGPHEPTPTANTTSTARGQNSR